MRFSLAFLMVLAVLTAVLAQDSVRTIEIVLQKGQYSPDRIEVQKGEKVRLQLKSMDVTHGFAIDELGVAREVSPGPPTVVEFTPTKAGTFAYYCVVRCGKNHKQMRGTLVVKE
jgi:cytochrome c oxidase subunit II